MKTHLCVAAAITLACAVAASRVQAQTPLVQTPRAQTPQPSVPLTWAIRADNDAFDFWTSPPDRPDEEYTNGVRGSIELSGMSWFERRWLRKNVEPCSLGKTYCATHTFSFGQDIYTGKLVPGDTIKIAGTRPNAGWLYVQESSKIESRDWLDETSLAIGVVGPPSLASQMVRAFHAIAPYYNRPTNWNTQLPFEPGVNVAFDHTQRVLAFGENRWFGGELAPHLGGSLGNILTEARAGLGVRAGYRIGHPWLMAAPDSSISVAFIGDATFHGVARNEFLAGTLFRSSEHVTERPFVTEYQVGVVLKLQQFSASWTAHQLSSEYMSRSAGHAWSRLAIEWQYDR